MDLAQIGLEIRRHRQARGLTQAQLAQSAQITRSTLNQLENGRTRDLGVRKVLGILTTLNLTLVPQPTERSVDFIRIATTSMNVSFKSEITAEELTRALHTGRVPVNRRAHMRVLLEESSAPLRNGLITHLSKSIPAGKLERNLEKIALAIGLPEATRKWLMHD